MADHLCCLIAGTLCEACRRRDELRESLDLEDRFNGHIDEAARTVASAARHYGVQVEEIIEGLTARAKYVAWIRGERDEQ